MDTPLVETRMITKGSRAWLKHLDFFCKILALIILRFVQVSEKLFKAPRYRLGMWNLLRTVEKWVWENMFATDKVASGKWGSSTLGTAK